jgi:protein O-GlcNAc transferase
LPTLAFNFLRRTVDQITDYQAARYYLGYVYFLLGDITRAQEQLLISQQLGSGPSSLAYYYLGEVYTAKNEWPDAVKNYERSIGMGDNHFETYSHYAAALQQTADFSKAIRAYRKALEVNPGDISTRISIGNILITELKDFDQAIVLGQETISLLPNDAKAHNLLGWALLSKGELPEAEQEIRAALMIDADLATAHYNLGDLLMQKDLVRNARDEYQLALDLDQNGSIAILAEQALKDLQTRT